jgi:two-component system nitrogen regulation sensor histidine kinase GlnL
MTVLLGLEKSSARGHLAASDSCQHSLVHPDSLVLIMDKALRPPYIGEMQPNFANELTTVMGTGLAVLDANLCVRWLNPALGELFGVGTRSAQGQRLDALVREPLLVQLASRSLAQGQVLQLRGAHLALARGRALIADIGFQPLAEGSILLEVHALIGETVEPTPLSATLRGFAHEVKNPLAGLRGAAQLLQRRVSEPDLRELAALVIAEADRLSTLADRLLRHGGGAQVGAVNIHELLERLEALVLAEAVAPRVRRDYDPSLPDSVGDADRLLQVLLNLTRNAIEAGARTLLFRTRVEHGTRLGEPHARSALRIDVIDDGSGVPDALRDTLFQPLVSGRADGTGLGLALSREIAREHGGELRFTSEPGETTFSLFLPMERAHD